MHVYATHEFEQKANYYGIQKKVQKLRQDIESAEDIHKVQQEIFGTVHEYLRFNAGRYRLIGSTRRIGEEQIVVLLNIFDKDREYEKFSEQIRNKGKSQDLDDLISEAELNNYLEKIQSSSGEEELPILPEELHPWLEPPGWEVDTHDIVIYESQEWVTLFRKPEIKRYWQTYHQIVLNSLSTDSDATNNAQEIDRLPGVKLSSYKDKYVLYSQIITTDSPARQVVFLIAAFTEKPSLEEIEKIGEKTGLFSPGEGCIFSKGISLEELIPLARRSYPDYLLAYEEYWLAIEGEEESNLALSAEEMRLLESVSNREVESNSLPIFINGRAGSGKSTMLLYLFADYCHRKYHNGDNTNLEGEPLFLTYNERLLEVAKKCIGNLLSSHHRFLGERKETDAVPNTDNFFKPFQQFLLELLPPEEGDRFLPDRYISFYRFQQLYQHKCNLPQAKKWNSELCWHAIRTFIKGYSCDRYMTPEDYQNPEIVSKKDRTISPEGFKEIYETIWGKWYQKLSEEESYWDDQDLIRKIIKGNYYRSEYAAVFCDEAQDFTKLELQLIMRLSLFSKYDLSKTSVLSLPFAFAGDPLQTLNPTGFRWESVKARFHEEVIKALDSSGQLNLNMNLQELEFNYRSSPPIVRFSNLIQLWRSVLFNMPELGAQREWKKDDFPAPQKFIFSENINPRDFKNYVQNTIIIVPCEEGGEKEYVQNDDVLSQMFSAENATENGEPIKNVLSAITAKGLEFAKVILYKFGEACNPAIWNEMGEFEEHPVEFEYFFNKFYVAASRAKERLFIVDSIEGDRCLWNYASSEVEIEKFLHRSKKPDVWRGNIQAIATGFQASDLREEDPLSIALEYESKGLNSEDPEFMRRSKQFYTLVGDIHKANLCEALALKFEEKFLEAGKAFMGLGQRDEARVCFWQGMCWSQLREWYEQYTDAAQVERALAEFMLQEEGSRIAILNFTEFLENCIDQKRLGKSFSPQWRKVVDRYACRISKQSQTVFTPNEWRRLGDILKELDEAGYHQTLNFAGECFFGAGDYQKAVECWNKDGATGRREYYVARARNCGFPQNLEWLNKAGDYQSTIEEWENAGKPKGIDKSFLEEIIWALRQQKRYWDGVMLAIELDDLDFVKKYFKEAMESGASLKQFGDLVKYLIERKEWIEAMAAIEESLPQLNASSLEKANFRCDVVRAIAYSDLAMDEMSLSERQSYEKMSLSERQDYDRMVLRERQRYENLIKEVTEGCSLPRHLNFKEIGSALERIGGYGTTLEFYEPLCEERNREKRSFARERWIATKRKQESYHRNKREFDKAEKIREEIREKTRRWGMDFNIQLLPYPDLSKYVLENQVRVRGLPNDIKLERREDGNIKFLVGEIEVQTKGEGDRRVLCFEDGNSLDDFRVIFHQKRLSGSAQYKELLELPHRLSFVIPASGYRGKVVFGEDSKHQIELKFRDLVGKVFIEI